MENKSMENKMGSAAHDLKNSLNGKAPVSTSFTDEMADRYEATKKMTTDAYQSSIEQVRQSPVVSLAAALAVGAVAGFIFGRRK